jgi:hypothetical protein
MKKAVWCFLLTCAALFAQDANSGNAAAEALKKRVMGMDLLNLTTAKPIVLAGPMTAAPKVCAIPLLSAIPPSTSDKMPVIKPQGKLLAGDTVRVPAPACNAARPSDGGRDRSVRQR